MFKRMSHLSILVLAAAFAASAEEIALETAGEAAQAWVDGGYSLGTMRGRRMARKSRPVAASVLQPETTSAKRNPLC